ncbi:hypothetical protein EIP91_000597, partial [Steccherinum ochraceum]
AEKPLPHPHAHPHAGSQSPPRPQPHQRVDQNQVNQQNEHYTALRARANEAGDQMAQCFERSHQAYAGGDGALAKELSNEGKRHQQEMERLNREASQWIFVENNKDSQPGEIDLHGLYVKEAITYRIQIVLSRMPSNEEIPRSISLLVRKGLHSRGGVAKLKPAIEELIQKHRLTAQLDPSNAGVLIVTLDGHHDHAGAGKVMNPEDTHVVSSLAKKAAQAARRPSSRPQHHPFIAALIAIMRFAAVLTAIFTVAVSSVLAVPFRSYEARGYDDNAILARDHHLVVRDVLQAIHARELAALDARSIGIASAPVKRAGTPPPAPPYRGQAGPNEHTVPQEQVPHVAGTGPAQPPGYSVNQPVAGVTDRMAGGGNADTGYGGHNGQYRPILPRPAQGQGQGGR